MKSGNLDQGVRGRAAERRVNLGLLSLLVTTAVLVSLLPSPPDRLTAQAALIGHWNFEGSASGDDETGKWSKGSAQDCGHVAKPDQGLVCDCGSAKRSVYANYADTGHVIEEKTFLVDLTLRGYDGKGSAMTVQTPGGGTFDAFVFGEFAGKQWAAGSNHAVRTAHFESNNRLGSSEGGLNRRQKVALVFKKDGLGRVRTEFHRDGTFSDAMHKAATIQTFSASSMELQFGARHGGSGCLSITIHEAWLFDDITSIFGSHASLFPRVVSSRKLVKVQTTPHLVSADGGSFKQFTAHLTQKTCQLTGIVGWLATPTTAEEDQYLKHIQASATRALWMGGTRDRSTLVYQWRWTDGPLGAADGGKGTLFGTQNSNENFATAVQPYAGWVAGEPQPNQGEDEIGFHGGWRNYNNNANFEAVCQFKREDRRFFIGSRWGTWEYSAAAKQCQLLGARLPMIYTQADLTLMKKEIDPLFYSHQTTGDVTFWLGAILNETTNEWHWADPDKAGKSLMSIGGDCSKGEMEFCDWHPGQPSGGWGEINTAFIVQPATATGGPVWQDGVRDGIGAYSLANGVVCEAVADFATETEEPTQTVGKTTSHSLTLSASVTPPAVETRTGTDTSTAESTVTKTRSSTLSLSTTVSASDDSVSFTDSIGSTTLSVTPTPALPRTTSVTLVVPLITLIHPIPEHYKGRDVLPISERGLSKKHPAGGGFSTQFIELSVLSASWQCSKIRQMRQTIFSPAAGEGKGGIFFRRIGGLLGGESTVACIPETNDTTLRIHFAYDKEFRSTVDENITLAFDPTVWLVDAPHLELKDTEKFVTTFTLKNDRPSNPVPLSKEVIESAETTAAVGSVVASAAGNPAMAVQGARTGLILDVVICEDTTEEEIGWMEHPTGLSVGTGPVKLWAGACLWNPIVVAGTTLAHFLVVVLYSSAKKVSLDHAKAHFYFPALQSIVVMVLSQPTASAVTTVFAQSEQESQKWAAGFSTLALVLLVGFVFYVTEIDFLARWKTFPRKGLYGSRHWFYKFLVGPGEYIDLHTGAGGSKKSKSGGKKKKTKKKVGKSRNLDTGGDDQEALSNSETERMAKKKDKDNANDGGEDEDEETESSTEWVSRYMLIFDLYRPNRVWFGTWEILLTCGFGVVEGWHPSTLDHCKTASVVTTVLFAITLGFLIGLRPYVSLFEEITMTGIIVGGQFISSLGVTIYMLNGTQGALDMGSWLAATLMYFLAAKSLIDLLILAYDIIVQYGCKTTSREEFKEEAERKKEKALALREENDEVPKNKDLTSSGKLSPLPTTTTSTNAAMSGLGLSQGLLHVQAPASPAYLGGGVANPLLRPLGQPAQPLTAAQVSMLPPPPPGPPPPPRGRGDLDGGGGSKSRRYEKRRQEKPVFKKYPGDMFI